MSGEGPAPEEFLSGRAGFTGPRRAIPARARDRLLDRRLKRTGVPQALESISSMTPARRVLALSAYRPESELIARTVRDLRDSRHEVTFAFGSTGEAGPPPLADITLATGLRGGKFENLNAVLAAAGGADGFDWVVVIDDDVVLPRLFLEGFIGICARLGLDLAQPAQTLASHAAWPVTRRRRGALVRETRFVEIGPVTGFSPRAAAELMPFPELRFGWGLDLHWAALARERGWKLGVIDALPVRHDVAGVAGEYDPDDAIAEARRFLAVRDFLPAAEAGDVLAVHTELA